MIREVWEETNITAEITSLIGFRFLKNYTFNCSDLYVLFALKALNTNAQKPDREILDVKWMNIEYFIHSKEATNFNKFIIQKYLNYKNNRTLIDYKVFCCLLTNKDSKFYHIIT